MDASKLVQRQIDEERAAGQADALRLTIRDMLKMLHTGLPGHVVSFDAATQTAKVQPAIRRIWVEGGSAALPEVPDVPVHFPGGGGYVLTFPVTTGDDCLLVFAERAIDFWFEKGGVQDPSEFRMHDLSDGFAFVGFRPKPNKVSDFQVAAAELRAPPGGMIYIGGHGPLDAFETIKIDPTTLIWLNAVGSATGAGPFPASGKSTKVKVE